MGNPAIKLKYPINKKSISTTRTFEKSYTKVTEITEMLSTFAMNCAEKLRKQKCKCYMLVVILSYKSNNINENLNKLSKTIFFSHPTNSSLIIVKSVVNTVKTMFKIGLKFKKAGVIISGLVPEDNYQLNLFSFENPKHKYLMDVIDNMNYKFKSNKIKLANQDLTRTWKMRQNNLSQKFTTNINDVIIVK